MTNCVGCDYSERNCKQRSHLYEASDVSAAPILHPSDFWCEHMCSVKTVLCFYYLSFMFQKASTFNSSNLSMFSDLVHLSPISHPVLNIRKCQMVSSQAVRHTAWVQFTTRNSYTEHMDCNFLIEIAAVRYVPDISRLVSQCLLRLRCWSCLLPLLP